MADIRSFPTELLDTIFQHVAAPGFQDAELPSEPTRALFPLNVSLVCTLWLNILKSHPRYWQRIVIDVTDDPAPFLDTFSLFKDEKNTPLDLIVLSSAPDIDKDLEYLRARTIFENLEPSITRYGTITFHLIYQSSLPRAADIICREAMLGLTELYLNCTIHNLDDYQTDLDFDDLPPPPGPEIPTELETLSVTGHDFMHLCCAGQLESDTSTFCLQLSVKHYTFRKKRFEGTVRSEFPVLMSAIEILNGGPLIAITLSDISSGYRPSTKPTEQYHLTFENLSFDNCSIPFLGMYSGLPDSTKHHLELVDIPSQTSSALPGPGEHALDDSICNAIEVLLPRKLQVLCCDGLTDDVFEWLTGDDDSTPEAPSLESILLRDCTQFTPASLISLLVRRYTQNEEEGHVSAIAEVEVHGKGPALSQGDVSRIMNDSTLRIMKISWSVERGDDVGEDFTTEFQCPVVSDTSLQDSANLVSLFDLL